MRNGCAVEFKSCWRRWSRQPKLFARKEVVAARDARRFNRPVITMQIRKNITGDEQELLVSGRIDGDGANQLELEILSAIKGGAKAIYVNLSETSFLCSAGIRVLLQHWRQLKNSGKKLLVTRP